MKYRRIRIDEDIYALLKKEAVPFEDEPNTVLRRMLGLRTDTHQGGETEGQDRRRISSKHLMPMKEFELSILRSLENHSGSASRNTVLEDVFGQLSDRLNAFDLESTRNKEPRWQSRAEFKGHSMRKDGYLGSESRGIWKLTSKGSQRLRELEEQIS